MNSFNVWHLFILVYVLGIVVPCWRIASKAGYPGALALLALVPGLNVILLWLFAFLEWPVERARS